VSGRGWWQDPYVEPAVSVQVLPSRRVITLWADESDGALHANVCDPAVGFGTQGVIEHASPGHHSFSVVASEISARATSIAWTHWGIRGGEMSIRVSTYEHGVGFSTPTVTWGHGKLTRGSGGSIYFSGSLSKDDTVGTPLKVQHHSIEEGWQRPETIAPHDGTLGVFEQADGSLLGLWTRYAGDDLVDVLMGRRTPEGWGPAELFLESVTQRLAVDERDGRVFVAYQKRTPLTSSIWIRAVDEQEAKEVASVGAAAVSDLTVKVAPDDARFVAWAENESSFDARIRLEIVR
jgi:hypothetical protein